MAKSLAGASGISIGRHTFSANLMFGLWFHFKIVICKLVQQVINNSLCLCVCVCIKKKKKLLNLLLCIAVLSKIYLKSLDV